MIAENLELIRLLRGHLPSVDEIEAIRMRKLRALINDAHQNVPYYRSLFDSAGLVPEDIRSVGDLRYLPVTTRDQLRAAGPDRIGRNTDLATCRVIHSSGSSGKPWAVYRTPHEDRLRRAMELRSMVAAGVRPRDLVASLGPHRPGARPMLGRFGLFRVAQVSPLLPVDEQVRYLREIKPTVFWVYPTALRALLAQIDSLSEVVRPRMIITSAEPLDDVLRQRVLTDRQVDMRNFYGSVENGRISWECAAHEGLHINADGTIVEFEDDVDVPGAGKSVVVTNLSSRAAPYIRYHLGDRCKLISQRCSCGSSLPLMEAPLGREWDVIQLPSGRLLSPWGCNVFLRNLENLKQFRLIQERVDLLVLQLRFSVPPASSLLDRLKGQLQQHMGEPVTLRIELLDHFDDDALKFRAFISRCLPNKAPGIPQA